MSCIAARHTKADSFAISPANHTILGRTMKSFSIRPVLLALLLAGLVAKSSVAAVTPIGDVLPADRLDTDLINEGLPPGGNFYDSSQPAGAQTRWENNDVIPGYQDVGAGIVVGQKAFGRLDIDGNSQLRYQSLVIGDRGEVGEQMRTGTGTVLITGIDALYNNDPNVLHPGLPPNFASVDPRSPDEGFDIYVGRYGQGTLDINGGGRAEIQDAVVVGDQPGSLGKIFVTGAPSYFGSGGFDAGGGLINEPHQMIIGRRGVGFMTIADGGTVVTESTQGTGTQDDAIAASIGSDPFDDEAPELGGQGTVTVTGPTSQWIVGGTLQIGGFHDLAGLAPGQNAAGEDVIYGNATGRGTLNISDGAIVALRAAIDADVENDPLRLVIGRFGRVELANGNLTIGSGSLQGGGGEGEARPGTVQLLNDGVIRGGGRIDTGVFRNRFFGEVRVDAGQKLIIDSSTEFTPGALNVEPLANWGLIQVIGTPESRAELEIERAPGTVLDPIQPFRNSFVEESPVAGRSVGQITAAHATLRFRSGLSNNGKLAFIAGDNFVSGPVMNEAGDPNPDAPVPAGEIAIAGNNTTVTFEDHFVNNGRFEVFPNSSLVLFENDFSQGGSGAMALTLGGRPTGNELSFLSILGDANLNGTLEVDLFSTGANPIDPMPGDEFQILAALGELTGIFTNLIMPNLGAGTAMFPVYDYSADTVTLHVASLMGVMGADFNGDGVVNGQDLLIWQQNVGIRMGATGAQGDADGDGDVDGDDFLEWQRQIGPVPGAGSGSGSDLLASVPEPGGLALLFAGSLALAAYRRRVR